MNKSIPIKKDTDKQYVFAAAICHFIIFILAGFFTPVLLHASTQSDYVGAEKCQKCHEIQYDGWKTSGHARIVRKTAHLDGTLHFPWGYSKKNTSYVIGGFKWKALFLDTKGYMITSTSAGIGKNQYNVRTRQWVDHLPGQSVSYDCGRCHTTGFSPEGHQNNLPGIKGTWKFDGVQCEACHGPGGKHVRTLAKEDIIIDSNVCAPCHGTEPLNEIPLDGVFLAQYSEANQLMKSAMRDLTCASCHEPHLPSGESIKNSCESCHQKIAKDYGESFKYKTGITCMDCHMPRAVMIAEGNSKIFRGDFKSHLFKIDHRKAFAVVEKNGKRMNPGYLTVDYSCIPCHNISRDRQWASASAMFSHMIKVTSNIKIMRLQVWSLYIGFSAAFLALLTGLYLRNYLLPASNFNRKTALTYHRLLSWTAFSIFVFNVILCNYFHFPFDDPAKALSYGWFLIHPINGILGAVFYAGKIIAVRKFKKGWKTDGLVWGVGLFIFWLIQSITVIAN